MSNAAAKNGNALTYRELARDIADNGYMPLPIQRGHKRPEPTIHKVTGEKWTRVTPDHIDTMVDAFGDSYVGILSDGLAAIDIDVYDAKLADVVKGWVKTHHPDVKLMTRYGRNPKLMIIGCAEHENQRKRTSAKFEHDGHDHQIEVLGCGQQLVAYAIHPDTKSPYVWGRDHLVNTPKAELGVITDEFVTKLFENFEQSASARGWKMTKGAVDKGVASDDAGRPVVVDDYDPDKARDLLRVMTDHDLIDWADYDQWVDVGMVLNMQGQGAYEWLELWQEFSEPDAHDVCADKWATFDYDRGGKNLDHLRETLHKAYDRLPQAVLEAHDPVLTAFPDLGDNEAEWDEEAQQEKERKRKDEERRRVPEASELVATLYDLEQAKLTPRCIVENYLYADVAQLVAPGGVGKTTIILYEMICIALGRDLWGHEVVSPGKTLLVTAEDDRGMLLARMGKIMAGMGLTNEEKLKVLESALIWDATENGRKLVAMQPGTGMMAVSKLAHEIAERYRDAGFQMVTFDPTVSFGASEARVNDNEQQLVMAARTIKRALDCCVRYIHHTGKLNAKEKALDQYAGRNGTALPDGTRMTSVMHPVSPGERVKDDRGNWIELPVEFVRDNPDAGFTVMTQPKLSYSPMQPPTWIARNGWTYQSVPEKRKTGSEIARDKEEAICTFLLNQLGHGVTHTISSAETQINAIEGVTKKELRELVKVMKARGLLIEEPLPSHMRKGSKATYLRPAEYGGVALPGDENWPEPLD